jgi:tripartite-type tricarboxylate transporter receptor subunit TctC
MKELAGAREGETQRASPTARAVPARPAISATELLQLATGMKMLHIPYKGTGPGMTALLGGEIQVLVVGLATVLPYVKAGATS